MPTGKVLPMRIRDASCGQRVHALITRQECGGQQFRYCLYHHCTIHKFAKTSSPKVWNFNSELRIALSPELRLILQRPAAEQEVRGCLHDSLRHSHRRQDCPLPLHHAHIKLGVFGLDPDYTWLHCCLFLRPSSEAPRTIAIASSIAFGLKCAPAIQKGLWAVSERARLLQKCSEQFQGTQAQEVSEQL
jgi:hypothetical protein